MNKYYKDFELYSHFKTTAIILNTTVTAGLYLSTALTSCSSCDAVQLLEVAMDELQKCTRNIPEAALWSRQAARSS